MVVDIRRAGTERRPNVPAHRPGTLAERPRTPASRRLAKALTAVAASGALLLTAAGTATAAPVSVEPGSAAAQTSAECLTAYFPGTQTTTTAATVDEWLSCMGLTNGTAYAAPTITRGEAADIAYAAIGFEQYSGGAVFGDVRPGDQFYKSVSWLGSVGVVQGYGDGEFRPERDITRDELAKLLIGVSRVAGPSDGAVAPTETGPAGTGAEPASEATAATAYEDQAAALLAAYGCENTELEIVDSFENAHVSGMTTMVSGQPATVEIKDGLGEGVLRHTAAHECMHVLQHEAFDYSPPKAQATLAEWYSEDYTTAWGPVSVYEQNAECALRGLGFARTESGYDVECDEAGLAAGRAIASGQDPNEVVAAG